MGPPKISSKKADQGAFSCIPGGFFMRSHNKLGPYEKSFMADQGAFSCIPGGFYMRSHNRLGPYGQFYAITFWPKMKIEKNVKIYQNILSRNYLCQKIVKGGW